MAGTFSVPARRLRSCLPPVRIGCIRVPRLIHNAPAPLGPLNLCADSDSRSTPSARTSTGILPTDCTASVCISAPRSCAILRELGDRLDRADLVVRVHDRDEGGVVGDELAQPIGRHDAGLIDREERRAPAAARQRLQRVQHGLVFDRARDEMTAAGRLERVGGAADREVVRLGAAAREHDLRRIAVDERRHGRSRLVERRFGLLPESDARSTRCRTGRASRARPPRSPRGRAGSWRCSQNRHASVNRSL